MDADVSRWILEFLIRQPVPGHLIIALLKEIPLSNDDSRLKKTILLREIEWAIIDASVPERVMDKLETIEELDRSNGIAVTDAMKAAYCAVAVECTVKYLRGVVDEYKYADAVNRIWIRKILLLERSGESELVSAELKGLRDDIEAAVWNDTLFKELKKKMTANEALRLVRAYTDEAWALMGPSFLELAGARIDQQELQGLGGVQTCDKVEEMLPSTGQDKRGKEVVKSGDNLVDYTVGETAARFSNTLDGVVNDRISRRGYKDTEKVNMGRKRKQNPSHICSKGNVNITDTEDMGTKKLCNKDDLLLFSSEADKVKEALKSSSLGLQAVVNDPLPEALLSAKSILSDMERNTNHKPKGSDGEDVEMHDMPMTDKIGPAQANKADAHSYQDNVPRFSPEQVCNTQANKADARSHHDNVPRLSPEQIRNARANKADAGSHHDNVPRFSPEQVCTAQATKADPRSHKLNNAAENSSSSWKTRETTKFARRIRKRWSTLEEETLIAGVKKYGKGNWKHMQICYRDIFEGRTEVDLKDKWRNMTK